MRIFASVLLALATVVAVQAADTGALVFNGTRYVLAHRGVSADGTQVFTEYVPEGETLDSWTRMVAVWHWPAHRSTKEVAGRWLARVQPLLTQPPQVLASKDPARKDELIAEGWISAPDKSYVEINLYRFVPPGLGVGVIGYQYAEKIRMRGGKGVVTEFVENRNALMVALRELTLVATRPASTIEQEIGRERARLAELQERYKDGYIGIQQAKRQIEALERERAAAGAGIETKQESR
jgi:hypothetical protein